jgi:hypothetical protein
MSESGEDVQSGFEGYPEQAPETEDDDWGSGDFPNVEINHSPVSLKSLHVEVIDEHRESLTTGTGFIFEIYSPWEQALGGRLGFVTNYHIVAGQRLDGEWVGASTFERRPKYLKVTLPAALGPDADRSSLQSIELPLYVERYGVPYPSWYSKYGRNASAWSRVLGPQDEFHPGRVLSDIAVIPLAPELVRAHSLQTRSYAWDERFFRDVNHQIVVRPTDRVYVLGYPDSVEAYSPTMPIWTTGSVANEVNNGPTERFFIDSRTRPGQSGSPVILYRQETYIPGGGSLGGTLPEEARLLGVYSGRTDEKSDIGSVWWGSEIATILGAIPPEQWPTVA